MKSFESVSQILERFRTEAERLKSLWDGQAGNAPRALVTQLIRPDLGPMPPTLRRFVEPVVALVAAATLVALLGMGTVCFTLFVLAGALMYAILTRVFGLELDVQMPFNNL